MSYALVLSDCHLTLKRVAFFDFVRTPNELWVSLIHIWYINQSLCVGDLLCLFLKKFEIHEFLTEVPTWIVGHRWASLTIPQLHHEWLWFAYTLRLLCLTLYDWVLGLLEAEDSDRIIYINLGVGNFVCCAEYCESVLLRFVNSLGKQFVRLLIWGLRVGIGLTDQVVF